MSDTPYEWGGENFCSTDAAHLYTHEPERLNTHGFPVQLDEAPESFCSVCLLWWVGPHQHAEGSEHRPPEKGTTE